MSFSIRYQNRDHEILYLCDYHKYNIFDSIGNKVKNPAFDENSKMLLNVKEAGNPKQPAAVAHFGRLLAARLRGLNSLERAVRIPIAIIPKSEANKVSPGLRGVAHKLASEDRRFEVPNQDILVRTKTIEKLANGGSRNVAVHLSSISANIPKVTSLPPWERPATTVLLVDDIGTTGNSIAACTELLYQAGANLVIPVVLGRTA